MKSKAKKSKFTGHIGAAQVACSAQGSNLPHLA